jgi:hypothetical protein
VIKLSRDRGESHPQSAEGTLEVSLQQDEGPLVQQRGPEIDLEWRTTEAAAIAQQLRAELADQVQQSVPLRGREVTVTTLQVPADASALQLTVGSGKPVNTYLYDCSSGTCAKVTSSVPASTTHAMRIDQPTSGTWKIALVPAPGVCPESSDCDRADIDAAFVLPSLGCAQATGRVLEDGRTVSVHVVLPAKEGPRPRALIINPAPLPCHDRPIYTEDGRTTLPRTCVATAGLSIPLANDRDAQTPRKQKHPSRATSTSLRRGTSPAQAGSRY